MSRGLRNFEEHGRESLGCCFFVEIWTSRMLTMRAQRQVNILLETRERGILALHWQKVWQNHPLELCGKLKLEVINLVTDQRFPRKVWKVLPDVFLLTVKCKKKQLFKKEPESQDLTILSLSKWQELDSWKSMLQRKGWDVTVQLW